MSFRRRIVSAASFLVAAMVLAGGALAWACSPGSTISVDPDSGAVGSTVVVQGAEFLPGPVQIHWNSASGPVIGQAQGPSFSAAVTIPDAPRDTYYIVAVGQGNFRRSAAFTITDEQSASGGSTGKTEAPGQSTGSTTATASGGGGTKQDLSDGSTVGSASGGNAQAREGATSDTASGSETATSRVTSGRTSGATSSAARGATRSRDEGSSRTNSSIGSSVRRDTAPSSGVSVVPTADRKVARLDSGRVVFGGSLPPLPEGSDGSARVDAAALSQQREVAPATGSAVADLFSGYSGRVETPSLLAGRAGTPSGAGSQLAVGLGGIGVGLIALMASFLVIGLRRRRVEVNGSR